MFTLFFYFPLSKSLLQNDIFSFVDLDVYYSGLRRYNKTGNFKYLILKKFTWRVPIA